MNEVNRCEYIYFGAQFLHFRYGLISPSSPLQSVSYPSDWEIQYDIVG